MSGRCIRANLHRNFIQITYTYRYMRILIIEDEAKLAKSLKLGLEQEGYAVDYLLDGESGQQRLELSSNDYDLVILDVMLPGKDGISVCRYWREKNITTPVLMLTARDVVSDKITGLDAGADDYLVKPFSFAELVARVRALLRRPTESLPVILRAGDIQLDTSTQKVTLGDNELRLTLKEFSLLEYLMRNPNQVITREQLLSHAWDFAFDSFSNVVDVHIKNLRKKLNEHSKKEYIETVRGLGFRFKA